MLHTACHGIGSLSSNDETINKKRTTAILGVWVVHGDFWGKPREKILYRRGNRFLLFGGWVLSVMFAHGCHTHRFLKLATSAMIHDSHSFVRLQGIFFMHETYPIPSGIPTVG